MLPNMDSNTPNRAFSKQDYSWMDRARVLAGMSTERQKHGAVIVSGGRLLSTGVNVFRNHPKSIPDTYYAASYHAEVRAISNLHLQHLDLKATLYVARVNNHFQPMMSRPCDSCWGAVVGMRVIWTTGGFHNGTV